MVAMVLVNIPCATRNVITADIDIFIRIKHTFATVFILFAFCYTKSAQAKLLAAREFNLSEFQV